MTGALNLEFWFYVAVIAGIYALFSLGIQVQFGFAGLLNFGAVAFMLVAAYTMAILVIKLHFDLWVAALCGLGASLLLGVVVALPTLRLRAIYLGVATIAVSEILRYLAINLTELTGGAIGTLALLGNASVATYNDQWLVLLDEIAGWLKPQFGGLATRDLAMAILVWTTVTIFVVVLEALVRSPWGRVLKAVREDEDVAAAMGKNVFVYKLQAFVIGGILGGLSGLFLAFQLQVVTPSDFGLIVTFYGFVIVLLAGTAKIWAVPIGSVVFALVFAGSRFFDFWPFILFSDTDRQYVRLMLIGAILIALMKFRPQGFFGRKEELVL